MPCYDDRPSNAEMEMRKRLDITTRLACLHCKRLERLGLPIPPFAKEWWKDHKKADAAREKIDQRRSRRNDATSF